MPEQAATRILVLANQDEMAAIGNALGGTALSCDCAYAENLQAFIHLFKSQAWDIILASYETKANNCIQVLNWVRYTDQRTPFIILADAASDQLATAVIEHHANDYIVKSALASHLGSLLERELSQFALPQKSGLNSVWRTTLNAISDAVVSCDADCKIIAMNPAAEKLFRTRTEQAQGEALCSIIKLIDEAGGTVLTCQELLNQQRRSILKLEAHQQTAAYTPCYLEISTSALRIPETGGSGFVLVFHDITETKRLLHQLSHDASHDPLTNLINRREFEKRLGRFLTKASPQYCGVLLFLDLDQFKVVNDSCGHDAGDELLRQVSNLLRDQVRERDTLARVGGDEFALLMEYCDVAQANRIAQNILKAFKQFRFYWPEHIFQIGVSIGVIPIDRNDMSLEKVLKLADHACYAAKEAGRNRYIMLREEDANLSQRQNDMQWAYLINEALEKNLFQLYKQKILPLAEHYNGGERYEILLRFQDPNTQRAISPGAFMSSAERYDLMPAIDRWVVNAVLQWLEQHPVQLNQLGACSINLSGRTIGEEAHAQRIVELIKNAKVPAEKICFEITEAAAIANSSLATCHINFLRSLGCKFALDDFGIGLASFNYLKNLPVDILKIDGSFVVPMLENPIDHAMVRSINEVGHIMGKQTIAEFVNSKKLLDGLAAIGIDYVQGYHIAKPIPINGQFALN